MTPVDPSPSPSFSIRPARLDDAAPLAAFAERVFRASFGPHNTASDMDEYCGAAFAVDRVRGELAADHRITALAVARGELAGYAQLCTLPAPPCVTGPAPIELKRLYVDPALHGSGVARALMDHAIELARRRGAQTLYLGVWRHNHRAIAFYRKYGFVEVGSLPFQLGRDVQIDPIMMAPLSAAPMAAAAR
jgi:ribosomal protein S18 acetylase RimI-like enzyme